MCQSCTPIRAIARISGGEELPELRGSVVFCPHPRGVLVTARLSGLPESSTGFFAMHIHQGSTCDGNGFFQTLGHYNPGNLPHPNHAGDLPPLLVCQDRAFLSVLTDRFHVDEIIGRTLVIHSDADDFRSQPSGNAGRKIGCGVIFRY